MMPVEWHLHKESELVRALQAAAVSVSHMLAVRLVAWAAFPHLTRPEVEQSARSANDKADDPRPSINLYLHPPRHLYFPADNLLYTLLCNSR